MLSAARTLLLSMCASCRSIASGRNPFSLTHVENVVRQQSWRGAASQVHIAHGVGQPIGCSDALATAMREQIASATGDAQQVFQGGQGLHGKRTDVVTPRFHLGGGAAPHHIRAVQLVPIGIRRLAWTASRLGNQGQAKDCLRIASVSSQRLIERLDFPSRKVRRIDSPVLADRSAQPTSEQTVALTLIWLNLDVSARMSSSPTR